VSTKVPAPKPGKDFAVAYVQFGSQAAADAVIQAAKRGALQFGQISISATPYLPFEQRQQNRSDEFSNLYVKHLPDDIVTDDDLRALFSPYGAVKSVRLGVCLHDENGHQVLADADSVTVQDMSLGRRFGFVDFEKCQDAKSALKGMNGLVVRNATRPLHVARFQSKAERQSQGVEAAYYSPFAVRPMPYNILNREGRNVYVKNLTMEVDEALLFNVFQVRHV
jgi:RNA recognition motif-containing protein